MTQEEITKYLQYSLAELQRLEHEVLRYQNTFNVRTLDEVDYLENIISLTRLRAFKDYTYDISRLLNIGIDVIGAENDIKGKRG